MSRDSSHSSMLETTDPVTVGGLLRATLASFLVLTILTGVVYPLAVTAFAKVALPHQAEGSLISRNGQTVATPGAAIGSHLIGQSFDQPRYFWGRPSATSPMPYNAASSSGSNTGPSAMLPVVQARVDALHAADPFQTAPIPVDLVTASGSGLDPHISPAAALYQLPRVARARGLDAAAVRNLIDQHTTPPTFGLLGDPVVNVLELNLALDALAPSTQP